MNEFKPSEYEILTKEPESMNVGKLNNIVRELRELLYQERCKKQSLQTLIQTIAGEHEQ
jgi:hypothetical protein